MTLDAFFAYVEDVEFAAKLGILSGFNSVKHILKIDKVIGQFVEELETSEFNRQEVFKRTIELLRANPNPEYRHPYDAALTGYLYVLSQTDTKLTNLAIEQILPTTQLWWSWHLAYELAQAYQSTSSESVVFKVNEPKINIHTEAKQVNSEYQFRQSVSKNIAVFTNSNFTTSSKPIEEKYGNLTSLKERIS